MSPSKENRLAAFLHRIPKPVMVISSDVGRGSRSLGNALVERLGAEGVVAHEPIEKVTSANYREDHSRYRWIVGHCPALLRMIYGVPFFYWRKYAREKWLGPMNLATDLAAMRQCVDASGAKALLAISHRPAFWLGAMKQRYGMKLPLYGLATDLCPNPGWKYLFWNQMDGVAVGYPAKDAKRVFPPGVPVHEVELPALNVYRDLASKPGDPLHVAVLGGFWGMGSLANVAEALLAAIPGVTVHVCAGDNDELQETLRRTYGGRQDLKIHGRLPDLADVLGRCGSVVTKPGLSSLLEARASGRKIFLIPGLPVIEEANGRYAIKHFGAEPFSVEAVRAFVKVRLAAELMPLSVDAS